MAEDDGKGFRRWAAEGRGRGASDGGSVGTSTPDDYATVIAREETTWSALITKLNLKGE